MPADVIEAPVETEVVETEPVESSVAEVTDSGESATQESVETESSETLRGSALWRDVKTATQEGKPLTPKQLSALNKAIHRADAIDQKYPEGLSAFETSLEAVKQLADDETVPIDRVIEETLQERQYFRDLDSLFTSGNPEFVNKMADASPEAFQQIAPSVFRKFAEVNPEGFSSYMAQTVLGHMNGADIPLHFKILSTFLPQLPDSPAKQQVVEAFEAIYGWSESLKGMAQKPVAPKAATSPNQGGDDRESTLQAREMNATRTEWNNSTLQEGINLVMSEAGKAATNSKTKLTDKEKQTVLSKVGEELEARLSADRRYGEAMQGYLKNGNRQAYVQRIQSERKKLIPGAVRRAVDDVIAARPKIQPKTDTKQQQKAPVQQQPGQPQFRRIAGHPKTLGKQVDLRRTGNAMLQRRQAYIVGEKDPVQWG